MAEPEDVIAEAALHATRLARELWARRVARVAEQRPGLQDLRRRLELFVAAVFPEAPEMGTAEPPPPPSFLARLARAPPHIPFVAVRTPWLRWTACESGSPGVSILSRRGRSSTDHPPMALEQAARAHRGTRAVLPAGDAMLRDLYLLAEAAAMDATLVRMFPRFAAALSEARAGGSCRRQGGPFASPPIRRSRSRPWCGDCLPRIQHCHRRRSSSQKPRRPRAKWAETHRLKLAGLGGPYRGVTPVPLWGAMDDAFEAPATAAPGGTDENLSPPGRSRILPRRRAHPRGFRG